MHGVLWGLPPTVYSQGYSGYSNRAAHDVHRAGRSARSPAAGNALNARALRRAWASAAFGASVGALQRAARILHGMVPVVVGASRVVAYEYAQAEDEERPQQELEKLGA